MALERYRLVFGTSHVYADLTIGDILYFGPWNKKTHLPRFWSCEPKKPRHWHPFVAYNGFSAAVPGTFNEVTHVAFHLQNMEYYEDKTLEGIQDGTDESNVLRKHLRTFRNLKTVSVIYCGTDTWRGCHTEPLPGQIIFRDDAKLFKKMKIGNSRNKYMMNERGFGV